MHCEDGQYTPLLQVSFILSSLLKMRLSIVVLAAVALAIVQASALAVEPEDGNVRSDRSNRCIGSSCPGDFCYKRVPPCYFDRVPPKAETVSGAESEAAAVEASATPSGRNVCHKVNGVLECVWVGPGPSPYSVEASAAPSRRVCHKRDGELECVWIGEPGPYSEDASPSLH
ncbi:hypothetical protein BGW39_000842 [Mortierella sp. 14UC]|nr:hypothetical protein BGW39_000842 [Mortierella sp. 14UC]